MAKYRISFGGRWHGTFSTLEEAETMAEIEAAHRDEIVFVVTSGVLRNELITAYPADCREKAREIWDSLTARASELGGPGT